MISRRILPSIEKALVQFPAVALLGPRQAGKTTLARSVGSSRVNSLYLDLERPSDLAKLADPELFLSRHVDQLVVLDEIQRQPDLFPVLRALIDEKPPAWTISVVGFGFAAVVKADFRILGRSNFFS